MEGNERNQMKNLSPIRVVELDGLLNRFLEEQIGSEDAYIAVNRDEISCGLVRDRRYLAKSAGAEHSKMEFEDMANQLIRLIRREPFELKYEITSLSRNGFTISPIR